jgi:copper oxidase (laccase) domain-containing protein
MISADQPTIFGGQIIAAVSSGVDGNMSLFNGSQENVRDNRRLFLQKAGIDIEQTTFIQIQYAGVDNFSKYIVADETHKALHLGGKKPEIIADAVVVTEPNHALFLPLADCAGAIIYDKEKKLLMISHLGRHSTEEQGGVKSVEYLIARFQSIPSNILVWLSPAVGKDTYPLHEFDGQSLHEVLLKQFLDAGVPKNNIEICSVNTAMNENYFSHSQHLAGNQASNDRFAIAAMMTD